ncbi:MAG: hypothetical protein IIB40_03355 [Candidatus Marinimicrobia bacterium]|nr:hypothetical protein [Candidatus Neomarinimicrobiota bacterium]
MSSIFRQAQLRNVQWMTRIAGGKSQLEVLIMDETVRITMATSFNKVSQFRVCRAECGEKSLFEYIPPMTTC